MIRKPSRPLLIRCINLPISRFGDYEQLSVKKNCESPTNSIKLPDENYRKDYWTYYNNKYY